MMMKLSTLFATTTALLSCITNAEEYVYGTDPKRDAEYDISTGMAGIQQAAKDPKLLAQLFQDMQVGCYYRSTCCIVLLVIDQYYVLMPRSS